MATDEAQKSAFSRVTVSVARVSHLALPFLPPRTVIVGVGVRHGGLIVAAEAELIGGARFTVHCPVAMASDEAMAAKLVHVHRYNTDRDYHAAVNGYVAWEDMAAEYEAEEWDLPPLPLEGWGEPRYGPAEEAIIAEYRATLLRANPDLAVRAQPEPEFTVEPDGVTIRRDKPAGRFDA